MTRQRQRQWLFGFAVVGLVAAGVAGWLVWLLVTQPFETAQALGRVF